MHARVGENNENIIETFKNRIIGRALRLGEFAGHVVTERAKKHRRRAGVEGVIFLHKDAAWNQSYKSRSITVFNCKEIFL